MTLGCGSLSKTYKTPAMKSFQFWPITEHAGCSLCGSKGGKTNKFPCSLPSGKETESEDVNSGSVSVGLLDTPSLTDPEKSPSPTPVTASPIHDEFNMNIHEEVGWFQVFFLYLIPSFLENTACAGFILQMTKLRFLKRFFSGFHSFL